jgi:3D (Asp-Asp-Asp) domain-containing protein
MPDTQKGNNVVNKLLIGSIVIFIVLGMFCAYKNQQLRNSRDTLLLSSDILNENINLWEENARLKKELANCYQQVDLAVPVRVVVTCYHSEKSQTDSTPFITAFNWRVRPGIIAVSIDLLEQGYIPGSKVYLKNFGVFIVGDIMNDRFSNRVDIWIPKNKKAFKKDNVLMVPIVEQANSI